MIRSVRAVRQRMVSISTCRAPTCMVLVLVLLAVVAFITGCAITDEKPLIGTLSLMGLSLGRML